jgi:hypothetical protein
VPSAASELTLCCLRGRLTPSRRERSYAGQIGESSAHPSTRWGPALAHGIAQRPLLQMGIRDGEYRGDVPAVRIADDCLAYQKRRLLRGLARLASCERNGDEDLYGAIWQCSRLQVPQAVRASFPSYSRRGSYVGSQQQRRRLFITRWHRRLGCPCSSIQKRTNSKNDLVIPQRSHDSTAAQPSSDTSRPVSSWG